MDEQAREQIYLRNQIEKIYEKIEKVNENPPSWLIVHPFWYENPDSPLYEYFNKSE